MTNQAVILIVMAGYMLMIIAIGILFARRSNKNAESYFLGGRTLGPWVSAPPAQLFRGRWQCHYRAGFPQQSFS